MSKEKIKGWIQSDPIPFSHTMVDDKLVHEKTYSYKLVKGIYNKRKWLSVAAIDKGLGFQIIAWRNKNNVNFYLKSSAKSDNKIVSRFLDYLKDISINTRLPLIPLYTFCPDIDISGTNNDELSELIMMSITKDWYNFSSLSEYDINNKIRSSIKKRINKNSHVAVVPHIMSLIPDIIGDSTGFFYIEDIVDNVIDIYN